MRESEHFIDSDGARIWSCSGGNGQAFLFFNGGPGCDDYLRPVAELLPPESRVVRFESRGCGRSTRDGRYDLATTIADAEAVRAHYGLDDVILLGHSQGPNHALIHAIRHPRHVRGIIGLAGGKFVDDRNWSEQFHKAWEETGGDLGGLEFDADPDVNRIGNASYREYCRSESLLAELAGISIPVAFINAAVDIRPNWPTRQLSGLLPCSRYAEIEGAAHMIWHTHAAELRLELDAALKWINAQVG